MTRAGNRLAVISTTAIAIVLSLPLFWVLLQFALNLSNIDWAVMLPPLTVLSARTILYNAIATGIAFVLAIPAAIVLARGSRRSLVTAVFLLLMAVLQPPVIYLYGWSQALRLAGLAVDPQSAADVGRCLWTLACWLWPIPAVALGLALRSLDRDLLDSARLDGAASRLRLRTSIAPALGAACITLALALQQFTVFEQTNIPVLATESRNVFAMGTLAGHEIISAESSNQALRIAGAAGTNLPAVMLVILMALLAWRLLRVGTVGLSADVLIPGTSLRSWPILPVMGLTLGVPLVAMRLALAKPISIASALGELWPQYSGSLLVCSIVAVICAAIGAAGTMTSFRWPRYASILSFLAGGQILALGAIHLLNRPILAWAYDSAAGVILVHSSLFCWINLLIPRLLAGGSWDDLRSASALDGAQPWQQFVRVILPSSWHWHLAGAILVFCLSFGETSAVMLLQPQRPQMLIPLLMTWVHMLRYDAMIEAALLLAGSIIIIAIPALLIVRGRTSRIAASALMLLLLAGCRRGEKPDEIWEPPNIRPLIYPRGIAYSPVADEFFVVDRVARIQRISSDGHFINEWQMPMQENGRPTGISVGPDGNVYVADTHYYRVMVYSPDGKLLRQWGKHGTGPGEFIYVTDVAFDKAGRIYVSEYGDNDRIQVFDADAKYLYEFGKFGTGDGQFARPQSMVIEGDTLYASDAGNHRIVVFSTDGKFIRNMGSMGAGPGQFRFPYGLDEDLDGNLIVTEFGNNRVQKIDRTTGESLRMWGRPGRGEGELAYPWASAVNRRGRIVVVDSGNNRLQVISLR